VGVEKPTTHLERECGATGVTVEGEGVAVEGEGVRTTYLGRHHGAENPTSSLKRWKGVIVVGEAEGVAVAVCCRVRLSLERVYDDILRVPSRA
jgi:hypothetical protein